jgi:type II secretory pathway pseudopilin PulG
MKNTTIRISRRRGLTLVELVMVIMVTLILGTFVWKAAAKTIGWANNSRMSIEISQMSKALDAFCMRFGDYPPDLHDQLAVWKFLKARFPRCPRQKYPDLAKHSPASALYFWLAGPNGKGYSVNATDPFGDGGKRIAPFYKFDKERVKLVDGVMEFFPPRSKEGSAPYLYFRGSGAKGYDGHPGWSPAKPYRDSVAGKWINPDTYQILCAGNDGKFGGGNHYPGGPDYDEANLDDITSFSQGDTLERAIPKLGTDKAKKVQ